ERATLERIGMPAEIVMRHRPPHFGHVFSGGYYASAYYSYMWSEVLDADAFQAFEEAGDVFDPAVAQRLYRHVLSAGGSRGSAGREGGVGGGGGAGWTPGAAGVRGRSGRWCGGEAGTGGDAGRGA